MIELGIHSIRPYKLYLNCLSLYNRYKIEIQIV